MSQRTSNRILKYLRQQTTRLPVPKVVVPPPPTETPEARALRAEQCHIEVNGVLRKHSCQAQSVEVLVNGQQQEFHIRIVAVDLPVSAPPTNGETKP